MFLNVLDPKRRKILPLLKHFRDEFYLAGGTGLALQIGHRTSIDFDFFSQKNFNTLSFFDKIRNIFKNYKIQKSQDEENTLTIVLDQDVQLSFFHIQFPLIRALIKTEYLNMASIPDIAAMKCLSITHRATKKDYVDLYFILQKYSLGKVLQFAEKKFKGTLDNNFILKSMQYFADVESETIHYRNNMKLPFEKVKGFLSDQALSYIKIVRG